jgi:hypothetical protein
LRFCRQSSISGVVRQKGQTNNACGNAVRISPPRQLTLATSMTTTGGSRRSKLPISPADAHARNRRWTSSASAGHLMTGMPVPQLGACTQVHHRWPPTHAPIGPHRRQARRRPWGAAAHVAGGHLTPTIRLGESERPLLPRGNDSLQRRRHRQLGGRSRLLMPCRRLHCATITRRKHGVVPRCRQIEMGWMDGIHWSFLPFVSQFAIACLV